jgi:hypothetical protein
MGRKPMPKRVMIVLALAGLLTACAASTEGLEPAVPPAHASGEGLRRPAVTAPAASVPASAHHHH